MARRQAAPQDSKCHCQGNCVVAMLATRLPVSTAYCRTIGLAGSWLSGQAGSPSSVMLQLPSWELDCVPWRGHLSILGMAAKQAISHIISVCCAHYKSTPLSTLTVPTSMAVSFAPVFSTAPGGFDPVAAALSQVGLPSLVYAQKDPCSCSEPWLYLQRLTSIWGLR